MSTNPNQIKPEMIKSVGSPAESLALMLKKRIVRDNVAKEMQ